MLKVKVDAKEALQVTATMKRGAKALPSFVEAAVPKIVAVAEKIIIDAIREDMPTGAREGAGIGNFMANRTKVEATIVDNAIILTISGKTEGETENREKSDGTVPNVSNMNVNLWNVHEYGGGNVGDAQTGVYQYRKDIGGVSVVRTSRAAGSMGPYQGKVATIVSGLTFQLYEAFQAVIAIAAGTAAGALATTATQGKVQIDKGARAALKRAGISSDTLSSLGVTNVHVSSSGQINLLGEGAGGMKTFISGAGSGIPTTINR